MQARGVQPGDRVALLGATSRALLTAIQATWLTGAAIVVLPARTRLGSAEEFREQTNSRVVFSEASLVVVDPDLRGSVEPINPERVVTFPELGSATASVPDGRYQRPTEDPDETAVLQFTSGSTAEPKGVVIPHRCIMENNDAMVERSRLDPEADVVVSWAPLYHDLGLVMLMTPAMTRGTDLVIAPPTRFVSSPGAWMEWMSDYRGTWTIGPNFAVSVSARMLAHASRTLDLSAARRIGNGSEPVDPKAMHAFASEASRHGLDPGSLHASYGMAEATVLITMPDEGTGFTDDIIDGDALERQLRAVPVTPDDPAAKRLARCGHPIRGLEIRIADPATGTVLDDRMLGEIEVRGTSVVPGYFRQPEATATAFRADGWLRTGDIGYVADKDLVICGRLKDIIIVGGRNILPDDLERAANDIDGVRKGNVIAFGVEQGLDRESVVIVAETKSEDGLAALRDGISRAVREAAGIRPSDIVLVRPGTLPKTSSGKVRRGICRARYLTQELEKL
jgi:fatty-acyl-CoA synthase